jgi:hypothetical protein
MSRSDGRLPDQLRPIPKRFGAGDIVAGFEQIAQHQARIGPGLMLGPDFGQGGFDIPGQDRGIKVQHPAAVGLGNAGAVVGNA